MNTAKPATPAPPSPSAPATNGDGAGAPKPRSYKDTLNLPKTAFPMKANLVQNEPASIKRWAGLYERVRAARKGAPKYTFHDGPPYANASIHMGHLMNKCLKDFVVRTRTMAGKDCPYVPGWDCHGLPIEHKVMTDLVEGGKYAKIAALPDDQRKMAVRRECQKHAEKYVKQQSGEMQRLLTIAEYDKPYLTMSREYEGATLEVLADLLDRGLVYRALKPVHWSIANQTALAEAELEYEDREDLSVYVDFEAFDADAVYDAFGLPKTDANAEDMEDEEEDGANEGGEKSKAPSPGTRPLQRPSFMIWTTTPWTLPANCGVAVHPRTEYALAWIDGSVTVVAARLVEKVAKLGNAQEAVVLATAPGARLIGLRFKHPFVTNPPACGLNRTCDPAKLWSVVAAEYVTTEDGTGLVHTAPGHGAEDYATGLREGLPVYCPVRDDGTFDATVPDFLRGLSVWDANTKITDHLRQSGHLFHSHTFTHSYPHDWRSKTPVIFRCTEQWFVSVEGPHRSAYRAPNAPETNLRELALRAVDTAANDNAVKFVPEWGRNRLRGMLESRPDWCISRQRAWGLPIPAFFTSEAGGGAVLLTAALVRAVAKVVREKGSDAWFQLAPADLLKHYDAKSDPAAPTHLRTSGLQDSGLSTLRKGNDILDVWFESGSSWNAVLRERGFDFPADLYLEGSDQHRGWFQLALLTALGATGKAPYRTLLTHGFLVDKHGRKMSKSLGNDIKVEDLLREHGADVCRWWVCSLSYENDVKVDMEFFNLAGESYRKVRNTLRFMLSNLDDYAPSSSNPQSAIPNPQSLEAWVLAEYNTLARTVLSAYDRFDFRAAYEALYHFCNSTLSASYLAAVKDRLYCDRPDSPRRRQTQAALYALTDGLCRLLAPVLCHTADEAWRSLRKTAPTDAAGGGACVHLEPFIASIPVTADPAWPKVMQAAERATKALEAAKAGLGVENPLDAGVVLPDQDGTFTKFDRTDLADLLGVSRVDLDRAATEPRILDLRAEPRCERSWKRDGTVKPRSDGGLLSDRDAAAIGVK